MCQAGFLLLTLPLRSAVESIGNHLLTASKHVRQKLFIKLEPVKGPLLQSSNERDPAYLKAVSSFLPVLYARASSVCKDLDVRLILTSYDKPTSSCPRILPQIGVILTDSTDSEVNIQKYAKKEFNQSCLNIVRLRDSVMLEENEIEGDGDFITYNAAVLGGTFDRLHNGHKVLLSSAVLRARNKVVVGIINGNMLKRKFLWELIEPVEKRKKNVVEFLRGIDPSLEYSVVPIYDPFGPSIEDPDVECIVVSSETKRGGDKVNEERAKRNMKALDMIVINLVDDPTPYVGDETKISSSNCRRNLLGTYLRRPAVTAVQSVPLLIALIGSESINIAKEIEKLGAIIIDCETIFYNLLTFGSEVYKKLVEELDQDFLETWGKTVNKEKLYLAVLTSKSKKEVLKYYIQQKIEPIIEKEIEKIQNQGASVVVLKLPTFLGVDYIKNIHEVWGTIIPEVERLQKLMKFYNLSEEAASQLLESESSNTHIVQLSHMIFCPYGNSAFISRQVKRAWETMKLKESQKVEV